MNDPEGTGTKYTTPLEGVTLESIQITLDLYRAGKAGIPINTLWQFACPILNHYQLELIVTPDSEVTSSNVEDVSLMLDVLETASMIWDYCTLDSKKKLRALDSLTRDLLGHNPERQESEQFMLLLGSMEALWFTLTKDATPKASDWMPCDAPVNAELTNIHTNGNSHYGPDRLDIPEAFALFSRPLLDNEAVHSDPDLLEEAMSRAEAYWELAHATSDHFDQHLNEFIQTHLNQTTSSTELRKEALSMIAHFQQLFPERR